MLPCKFGIKCNKWNINKCNKNFIDCSCRFLHTKFHFNVWLSKTKEKIRKRNKKMNFKYNYILPIDILNIVMEYSITKLFYKYQICTYKYTALTLWRSDIEDYNGDSNATEKLFFNYQTFNIDRIETDVAKKEEPKGNSLLFTFENHFDCVVDQIKFVGDAQASDDNSIGTRHSLKKIITGPPKNQSDVKKEISINNDIYNDIDLKSWIWSITENIEITLSYKFDWQSLTFIPHRTKKI